MAQKDLPKQHLLKQSRIITNARYNFNVHEKRILYRVVELIQRGKLPSRHEPVLWRDKTIEMPVSDFMLAGPKDKNHALVKAAFSRLMDRVIRTETDKYRKAYPLVTHAKVEKGHGVATFKISDELYRDLLNFAKGYSRYELDVAFGFRSQYTMRFYELISKPAPNTPLPTYTIDQLRKMFILQDRYPDTHNFCKYVIAPAQRELEASQAPYYFEVEKVKTGRKITAVKLYIHQRQDDQAPGGDILANNPASQLQLFG